MWKEYYSQEFKVGEKVELIQRKKALIDLNGNKIQTCISIGEYNIIRAITKKGYFKFKDSNCSYNPQCFKKVLK